MRNKKGFTLVEMLAVIVILGVIMAISVFSVNSYIEKSKKDTYVSTAHEYMTIASNLIAQQKIVVRDSNTVYYVHVNNLDTEKRLSKSPYGKWIDAYVVVTVDNKNNNVTFYWTSVDEKGFRVDLTKESDLSVDSIYHSKDLSISPSYPIGGRDKIVVYDKDGKKIIDEPSIEVTYEEAQNCYSWEQDSVTKNITITGYDKSCGLEVDIPSYIEGKPVTKIGAGAFKGKGITSVNFYKGIETIGYGAFQGNKLNNVKLSQTVTIIEDYAFYNSKVSNLILSDELKTIGNYAFASNNICKVSFPTSLTKIGTAAFSSNCLSVISVPAGTSIGAGAFTSNSMGDAKAFIYKKNDDGTVDYGTIVGYAGTATNNLVIPEKMNGVPLTTISSYAFKSAKIQGHVDIPDSVTHIGSDAFAFNSIKSVKLPASLKKVDSGAFRGNYITKFDIPAGVTSIAQTAFNNNAVKGEAAIIYARKSDGSIDYSNIVSFAGSGSKTGEYSVTIPAVKNGVRLKNITGSAFSSAGLKEINLPPLSEVPELTIDTNAFTHNNIPTSFKSEYCNGGFFYKVSKGKINYSILSSYAGPGGGVSGTITIPESFNDISLTTINASFTWMSYKKIVVPSGVTSISNGAFGKGASNNANFVTIVNKTGKSFNWGKITSSSYSSIFEFGIVKHQAGNIGVVNN